MFKEKILFTCLGVGVRGGRGVQEHKPNPDIFVINYVTPIRDTFTDWINISIYLISEINSRQITVYSRRGVGVRF